MHRFPAGSLSRICARRQLPLAAVLFALVVMAPTARADGHLDSLVAHGLDVAGQRLEQTAAKLAPGSYPHYTAPSGTWVTSGPGAWTSGFLAGEAWLMYEATGDLRWRQLAEAQQAGIESQKHDTTTHDLGFMLMNSFGNGYRLTGDDRYRRVTLDAAASLATRWNSTVGAIRSWNNPSSAPATDFRVIIDAMMNLELLRWAAANGGDATWASMAASHALRTMSDHVRPDGSTYHLVISDSSTGAVKRRVTAQGYGDESTWARGQAWAIYGFTQTYRSTSDVRFLDSATRVADWYVAHLPTDKVPYWDFSAPGIPNEPRDSSAAAIATSALLELSRLPVSAGRAAAYSDTAEATLASLLAPPYLSENTSSDAILLHGTSNKPAGRFDTGLVYGDYYLIEALVRYRALHRPPPSQTGPPPQQSAGGPAPTPLRVVPPFRVTATAGRQRLRSIRRARAITVSCTLNRPGTCQGTATIAAKDARALKLKTRTLDRRAILARGRVILAKAGTALVKLKLSRTTVSRLEGLRFRLKRSRRTLKVRVEVTGRTPGSLPITKILRLSLRP